MSDDNESRKRELEEPCLNPVATKRVCTRPVVADTSVIATLANEITGLIVNKGNMSRDLRRTKYTIDELLKQPDDRSFSLSPDDRRKLRRFLDRSQEDNDDEESASTSNRQQATQLLYHKVMMTFLVDTLNVGLQMENLDSEWYIRLFIVVSCLHKSPLDPMVETSPDRVRRDVHRIIFKAIDLLAVPNQSVAEIGNRAVEVYQKLRAKQVKYIERLYTFRGDDLLLDILSWKTVCVEPYKRPNSKLARCYLTHQLFTIQDLMRVSITMYNETELVFPVHVTLAPFLTVFQFFVNMGPMLASTATHLKEHPGKWLDEMVRIYHLANSSLDGFLTTISSLDLLYTLDHLVTE